VKMPNYYLTENPEREPPTFVCTDCEYNVYMLTEAWDGVPVCSTCQFVREHPDIPEDLKLVLRR